MFSPDRSPDRRDRQVNPTVKGDRSPAQRLLLLPRDERHCSLSRQEPESEGLLQIQFEDRLGMAQVADRDVLPDVQCEITATGRKHEATFDSGRPNDPSVHHTLNMVKD